MRPPVTYRQELEERYHLDLTAVEVITDTDTEFSYRRPGGLIVGFNKCEFPFWRNRPDAEETHETQ